MRRINMLDLSKLPPWERSVIHEDELLSLEANLLSSGEEITALQILEFIRKLSQKSLEKTEKAYNQIFTNAPVEKAKQIAKTFADEMTASNTLETKLPSLTYGEIEFFSFLNIIQRCCPTKGDVFIDLGHGTGRALIAAALLFGSQFSKLYGVELIPGLQNECITNIMNYQALIKEKSECFPEHPDIIAVQGDFLALEDGISSSLSSSAAAPALSSWLKTAG